MKEKKEKVKEPKVKMSKKRKIVYSVVSAVMLGGGVFAGIFLANYFTFTEVGYGTIAYAKSIEDDNEEIMTRYNAKSRSASQLVSDFKPNELAGIATTKLKEKEFYHITGIGEAVAEVSQDIHSTTIKNKDNYFVEQLSGGLISVAKRLTQQGTSANVFVGELGKDTTKGTWPSSPDKTYSELSAFEEEWGRDLTRPDCYIVSEKTLLTDKSSAVVEGDNIVVTLGLTPIDSVIRYVRQMKMVSDLSSYPSFRSIEVKMTLDASMNILERSVVEDYTVNKIGNHDTVGKLVEKFTYEENPHIPSMKEDCVY